ncbi:MAG TPA: DMT family transporter [Xanthobacteraceae bacterium]|jgi:drug/metabolite transporter (DMT)-like permease|nr:DMT family transporter [Xanthobacteraceae bacterium]
MSAESRPIDRRRLGLALAALMLGAVAMGVSPIFVRLADVGPYASAFWRTFLALPFLFVWAHLEDRGKRKQVLFDRSVLLVGVLFAGDLFFWHLSILATTVANATFLATTAPIWVALGAWLAAHETIGARTLIGLALCMLGGFALLGQSYGFAPQRLVGDAFGIVTSIFFGSYILAVRLARRHFSAARLSFLSTAVTAGCLFLVAIVLEPRLLPQSAAGAAALFALALISQVAGQGLLAVALGTLPATFSSLVIFIEAIAAAGFGWLVLGEALGWLQGLGGVLIVAGIWVARPQQESDGEG